MITVAIIEDLATYRDLIKMLLDHAEGFECCAAYDSAEAALKDLPKIKPHVALIDIHLPGMNGIELVKCLREINSSTLCMMCTAYDEDEDVFKALRAGAHSYMLKSTPPAEILLAIKELIAGGSPMNNEIARKVILSFQQPALPKADFDITRRENEVLLLLSQGFLYKKIAAKLFISLETVRRHCFNVYTKLHVKNKTEAINKYFGHFRQ